MLSATCVAPSPRAPANGMASPATTTPMTTATSAHHPEVREHPGRRKTFLGGPTHADQGTGRTSQAHLPEWPLLVTSDYGEWT